MPEGPSIVILKEKALEFKGSKVIAAHGSAKIDMSRFEGQTIIDFKSHGKHFLICFKGFTVRIHLLMFGTYLINQRKSTPLKIGFIFSDGEFNLYTCNVKILDGNINNHYDWSADVMNVKWSASKARAKLKAIPEREICDALLDQDYFAGIGNIIKSEILWRRLIHPESEVGKIPAAKLTGLMKEAQIYSFEFLKWKTEGTLKKHWEAYTKKNCKRCGLPMHKEITGKGKRRSFFCPNCQKLFI